MERRVKRVEITTLVAKSGDVVSKRDGASDVGDRIQTVGGRHNRQVAAGWESRE